MAGALQCACGPEIGKAVNARDRNADGCDLRRDILVYADAAFIAGMGDRYQVLGA